jgi:hypothetical protein
MGKTNLNYCVSTKQYVKSAELGDKLQSSVVAVIAVIEKERVIPLWSLMTRRFL